MAAAQKASLNGVGEATKKRKAATAPIVMPMAFGRPATVDGAKREGMSFATTLSRSGARTPAATPTPITLAMFAMRWTAATASPTTAVSSEARWLLALAGAHAFGPAKRLQWLLWPSGVACSPLPALAAKAARARSR